MKPGKLRHHSGAMRKLKFPIWEALILLKSLNICHTFLEEFALNNLKMWSSDAGTTAGLTILYFMTLCNKTSKSQKWTGLRRDRQATIFHNKTYNKWLFNNERQRDLEHRRLKTIPRWLDGNWCLNTVKSRWVLIGWCRRWETEKEVEWAHLSLA